MGIADRVRNICVDPTREWPIIEREDTRMADLVAGYLVPLAALGAVAGFIGGSIVGATIPFMGTVRQSFVGGLVSAGVAFVLTIVGCLVLGWIINALAPTFGGRQDTRQAFKVAVYAYTPGLVAGVLAVLPMLSALAGVVAGLYGLYLLYLGLPVLMKTPTDKAVAYTAVVVVCAIVGMVAMGAVLSIFGTARSLVG